jgi:hypothetical protein
MASRLAELKERTEIRDAQGNIIGVFTPQLLLSEPLWSLSELEEAEKTLANEGHLARPLAEIWRDIRRQEPLA